MQQFTGNENANTARVVLLDENGRVIYFPRPRILRACAEGSAGAPVSADRQAAAVKQSPHINRRLAIFEKRNYLILGSALIAFVFSVYLWFTS